LLSSRITRRQKEIRKAMPDALDLLTICVEAGLGFDAAMQKVFEKWDNELARAFGRVIREIQLGKLRREALRDMATRLGVEEMTSFVAAVIQSEQLGVSMAHVLRIQSDQMRVRRRQMAEEEAHKAPIKMLIPMALLIFPSICIVLMTPAVIMIITIRLHGDVIRSVCGPPLQRLRTGRVLSTQEGRMPVAAPARYRLYRSLWRGLDWLYPPVCAGCGGAGERWCERCQAGAKRMQGEVCPVCGAMNSGPGVCAQCRTTKPHFKQLRSWAAYEGPLRKALQRLKYKQDLALGEALARPLIELWPGLGWHADLLLPVPLGVARLAERGYNQSALLARPLGLAHASRTGRAA
jgi:hypothetical protein